MKCPKCGSEMERDMVDVGVGEIPAGPWGCPECDYVEPSPLDDEPEPRALKPVEQAGIMANTESFEYVCTECGETCISERSDEDAHAEAVANFGVRGDHAGMVIVCDDCYNEIMARIRSTCSIRSCARLVDSE